jgi:hypothetical protein
MLDYFAGNSFVLKILRRAYACNPLKTMRLHPKYGGDTMVQLCTHIKPNGLQCQSPAMRGSDFCYFHPSSPIKPKEKPSARNEIKLPPLIDAASIQAAIAQVMAASLRSRLTLRRARQILFALRIASQNIIRSETKLLSAGCRTTGAMRESH